jgi:hypothetical protein
MTLLANNPGPEKVFRQRRTMKNPTVCLLAAVLAAVLFLAPCLAFAEGADGEARTSFFNQKWLSAVVSLEVQTGDGKAAPAGTGFLVLTEKKHVLLVTSGHVVQDGKGGVRKGLAYRLNETGGESVLVTDRSLEEKKLGGWFLAKDKDVACRYIGWRKTSSIAAIPLSAFLLQKNVEAGASMVVLGFPLGLRSTENALPIARKGMVARSDPGGIIGDVFVFPGNSGGPALYVPALKVGEALKSPLVNEERFIGVVRGFIPYVEPAVGAQTGRTRVIFEENTGLARIIPADTVHALVTSRQVLQMEEMLPDLED